MDAIEGWEKIGENRWRNKNTGKILRVTRVEAGRWGLPHYLVSYGRKDLRTFPERHTLSEGPDENRRRLDNLPKEREKAVAYAIDWMRRHPDG